MSAKGKNDKKAKGDAVDGAGASVGAGRRKPSTKPPSAAGSVPPRKRPAKKRSQRNKESAPPKRAGSEATLPSPPATAEARPQSESAPTREAQSGPPPSGDPSVDPKLRELEERLRRLTRSDGEEPSPTSIREQVSVAAREVAGKLAAPVALVDETSVLDTVRDLLSSDYYLRQWGRLGMKNRSEEVDDFGLDPVYEEQVRPVAEFLYKRYFRVKTEGVEHIPSSGRCLVVANHSGTLPLDGFMLRTAVRLEHPAVRDLRWLAEDFVYHLPFAGAFMSRVGGVRACQDNAERLLGKESLVAVFPEGVKGIGKLYRDRYKLQRFGRGGFIRLCLRTGTPLVPCAVVGAEEGNPMLHRDEVLSKLLGLPYLPVTATFPWFGPLGLVPAPTKWRIQFGEAIRFDGYGPEAADDSVLVGRLSERVRASIQQMLETHIAKRKSIWFG